MEPSAAAAVITAIAGAAGTVWAIVTKRAADQRAARERMLEDQRRAEEEALKGAVNYAGQAFGAWSELAKHYEAALKLRDERERELSATIDRLRVEVARLSEAIRAAGLPDPRVAPPGDWR